MATTRYRPRPKRSSNPTNPRMSPGLSIFQGRSNAPSAQRHTAKKLYLPISMPTLMGSPALPAVNRSTSTSLTRSARYAFLLMGMTSYIAASANTTFAPYPPIEASPSKLVYSQLWTNWCGPRGSEPDPQGQSGGPEGPAVKAWGLLTSKDNDCACRPTRPGDPFCWSTGEIPDPQGRKLVHRVNLHSFIREFSAGSERKRSKQ